MNKLNDRLATEQRYRHAEHLRALGQGPLSQALGGGGVCLLIAIQHFDAALWQRGLLAGLFHGGLICSPLILTLTTARLAAAPCHGNGF